jgi:cerevisin
VSRIIFFCQATELHCSLDTGIYTGHSQFGGRARWGATFGGYANADGNGHGTHCAGTVGSSQYGVSKAVSLIAVKVLSDAGSGSTSDMYACKLTSISMLRLIDFQSSFSVSGLNWVLTQARSSGRPSIVSMSLGGGAATALDNAVASLTSAGVHVAVAAGNSATDAGSTSPARAPSAVTVGATTISDTIASYSNYGSVVDIFAPGTGVTSTWIGSTTATNNISGTSMATPHVAGLIAYLISLNGNVSPATMSTNLKSLSTKNAISGIREPHLAYLILQQELMFYLASGTVNYLAFNGVTA